jgi:hypothetical protein
MELSNDGLTLWYGTADAPAPTAEGGEAGRSGVSVTVGVRPPGPGNSVSIRYRVDGGLPRIVRALPQRTDYVRSAQYFRAVFPEFHTGEEVEYAPLLTSAGRFAPSAERLNDYPSRFRLRPREVPRRNQAGPRTIGSLASTVTPTGARFPYTLEFVARVQVNLQRHPEVIGSTPAGFVASWYPDSGTVRGPRINANVMSEGTHALVVQPDGVGFIDVDVSLLTDDKALIRAQYTGVTDLGPDGYEKIQRGAWPAAPKVRVVPRFLAAAPKYAWLNRLQCAGFGELRPRDLVYTYDLYALQ